MNHSALLEQMKRLGLTDAEAMHELSEARLISDNCVKVWDIAQPDLTRCVEFLRMRKTPEPKLESTFRDRSTGLRMGRYVEMMLGLTNG